MLEIVKQIIANKIRSVKLLVLFDNSKNVANWRLNGKFCFDFVKYSADVRSLLTFDNSRHLTEQIRADFGFEIFLLFNKFFAE